MAVTAVDTTLRPFTVDIPEAALEVVRARIAATRWPEKETVEDRSQGTQLATTRALARYDEHDIGGHFAAWEQPQLLSEDVRATFRSLR